MPLGFPGRRELAFCIQELGRRYFVGAGQTELPFNLISGGAELLYGFAHAPSELRQFLRAEQEEYDEEDYHHVRPGKIKDTSDHWSHKRVLFGYRQIVLHLIQPIFRIYIPGG